MHSERKSSPGAATASESAMWGFGGTVDALTRFPLMASPMASPASLIRAPNSMAREKKSQMFYVIKENEFVGAGSLMQ